MTKEAMIKRTLSIIENLPLEKVEVVSDFADFIFKKFEEEQLSKGIQVLVEESETFSFLKEEEELYTLSDLKEIYND